PSLTTDNVLEVASLSCRIEDRPCPRDRVGLTELLKVDEEESLILPVEKFRNRDRAANTSAKLMEQCLGAPRMAFIRVVEFLCGLVNWTRTIDTNLSRLNVIRGRVTVGEPIVGIQTRVSIVIVGAAVIFIIAGAGGELDLDRALACALGPRRGSRKGDFLDRVHTRGDKAEEPIAILVQVILRIKTVNRDVVGARRQAVDRGVTRTGRCR